MDGSGQSEAITLRVEGRGCVFGRQMVFGYPPETETQVQFRVSMKSGQLQKVIYIASQSSVMDARMTRLERLLLRPDVGPVQGRNPSGLRFLRRFRLARTVEGDRLANERLEGGLVNFFSCVDVDRAACVSVKT